MSSKKNEPEFITPAEAARQSEIIRATLNKPREDAAQKRRDFENMPVTLEEKKAVDDLVRAAIALGYRMCSTTENIFRLNKAATEMGFPTRVSKERDYSDSMVDCLEISF